MNSYLITKDGIELPVDLMLPNTSFTSKKGLINYTKYTKFILQISSLTFLEFSLLYETIYS